MTLHQKAVVALTGLWAMHSREAVYFTAMHDSEGRRLRAGEDYIITGCLLPAEWWSVTAYCNYHFIPNSGNRYSRSSTNLHFQPDGSWCIQVSAEPSGPDWIPAGRSQRGLLTFSLRLYLPQPAVFETPSLLKLPVIQRVSVLTHSDAAPANNRPSAFRGSDHDA